MPDVLRLADPFYILAEAERPEAPRRVLKHDETFGVFDQHGDIVPADAGELGIYHDGTRFLSRMELRLGAQRLQLLSSSVSEDNAVFTIDLANPDVTREGEIVVARGEIHVFRSLVLWDGACYQQIRVSNYSLLPLELPVSIVFDSDYADVFEVRGIRRPERGSRLPTIVERDACTLRYLGLDGVERTTRIGWSQPAETIDETTAVFHLPLEPHAHASIELSVTCDAGPRERRVAGHQSAFDAISRQMTERSSSGCRISSSSELFNRWMTRSASDLRMMITDTPHGLYPYAGVPWFSTPFGRDGIVTAFELLWAVPDVARGVLSYLAATQATSTNDRQDAQPGKILHETRGGEMAALGEVPFGRYYGTIDATPLFLMLADEYFERTGDRALIDRLWPHLLAAVEWMTRFGDIDGDGLIEYARRSEKGLVQQGWKDSHDSVFHADGTLAEPPIALCEVQGYAYAAWRGVARLAALRGETGMARRWEDQAERVRERFEASFWCEDLGMYALALDGQKRPCRIRTSNPGHCLLTGIARPDRARRVVESLTSEDSFAGWGVRTLAAGEPRYNPMSYHNGSIWPHDNALVAAGLSRYGCMREAERIFSAMFDLSQLVDVHRLPELICGFRRRPDQRPTLYPVACAPQAWAAGAVYLFLQASLGLRIDALGRRITFSKPLLPPWLDSVHLSGLQIGDSTIDLLLERHPDDVGVIVLKREAGIDIVTIK